MSVNIRVFLVYSVYDFLPNYASLLTESRSSFAKIILRQKKTPAENIPQVPRVYVRITVLYLKFGHRITQQISHLIQISGIAINAFHDSAHLRG